MNLLRKDVKLLCLQGVLFSVAETCKTPPELVRLWMHEASRVYRDKLTDEKDFETFDKLIKDVVKKSFEVGIYKKAREKAMKPGISC